MTHILTGDARQMLATVADKSVHCCVTSPPYFNLRNYDNDSQIGLEPEPDLYIEELVRVFREVKRVLRNDGTLWLNIGDSYSGSGKGPEGNINKNQPKVRHLGPRHSAIVPEGMKPKDLIGIPWMLAFALRDDGWYLRQDIIWHKTTVMPESVKDRCTRSHEYLFLLSKSRTYYYDANAIRTETGANKRSVWSTPPSHYAGAHFATFPPELVRPCIRAGCPAGGTVLDPFLGSGTTLAVAIEEGRDGIGVELNPDYVTLAEARLAETREALEPEVTELF